MAACHAGLAQQVRQRKNKSNFHQLIFPFYSSDLFLGVRRGLINLSGHADSPSLEEAKYRTPIYAYSVRIHCEYGAHDPL
jgi:hypothetical protein